MFLVLKVNCERKQLVGQCVQLHTQGRGGGNTGDPQRIRKETVLPVILDGIEVRLALGQ